jgi:regulatory protein
MRSEIKLTPDIALDKMRKYCAYQERCHEEVRYKLVAIGVRGDILESILSQLIEEGLLNEERFARAYVRGKFRNNQWGMLKITKELTRKNIGSYLQEKAREEIDPDDYQLTLRNLLTNKKLTLLRYPDDVQKLRLFKYAYQKGFEPELIYELIPLV